MRAWSVSGAALVSLLSFVSLALSIGACGTSSPDTGAAPDASLGPGSDGGGSTPSDGGNVLPDGGSTTPDGSHPPPLVDGGGLPDVVIVPGAACGWKDGGTTLHVGAGLDLCMPPVACNAETCPPTLGTCTNGSCVFKAGYSGVATLAEAWATYYCQLSTGGCHGITQKEFPEVTAQKIATSTGFPLCEGASGTGECVGIAASSPMVVGNSQLAVDQGGKQVKDWGLGLTEASGLCYELTGPGGAVLVALTDRCGGYCKCSGSGFQECGPCVNAADMQTNCPCVGSAPPAYAGCCGATCGGTVNAQCDWCASNNHPHFDLDTGTFNKLCAAQATQGSCKLTSVKFVHCLDATAWPP